MNKNKFPINILVKLEKARINLKTLKATRDKKRKREKKRMLSLLKKKGIHFGQEGIVRTGFKLQAH